MVAFQERPDKPHAVCIPCAAQSHIKSMLKLAKLLHRKGFHITFVNTEFTHQRLLKSRGPDAMDGLRDFRFESIPDGLPPSNENATQDAAALCEASKNSLALFNALLDKLNDSASSNVPPVTCIVSDGFMPVTIDAAEMHQIPIALFFTISACSFMGYKHFQALQEKGLTPLKDESFLTNGYLDKVVDWIPGMRGIRLRDLPSFIRTTDPDDFFFKFCAECAGRASEGSAVIFHTFDVLEQEVLNALYTMFPRVYTIGPLELLLNQKQEADLISVGCKLWKEVVECLHWLDSNKPRSVIYVNFGSIVTVTNEQLVEFGLGLAESGHQFLWIIRPDMVVVDSAILPPEYSEETKEVSFICSWCPQEEVLNHPSIGGFLTHSGWGSTIESISCGMPMLCWPFRGDQQTNSRYTCPEWGIGMEIDSNVKRENVKKLVLELMEGEKG
uniref:Glycosyltransferase n=1 Tax=Salix viminalis TaxID=40686 RepID=A0A6N2K234_SALVM